MPVNYTTKTSDKDFVNYRVNTNEELPKVNGIRRSLSKSFSRSLSCSPVVTADPTNFQCKELYRGITTEHGVSMVEGTNGVFRHAEATKQLFDPPVGRTDLIASFEWMMSKSGEDQDCVGEKPLLDDGTYGPMVWTSKIDFYTRCLHMAEGFRKEMDTLAPSKCFTDMGFYPEIKDHEHKQRVNTCRFMGVAMKNRIEYTVMEFVAQLLGICLVPIYGTLGPVAMSAIVQETDMETMLVDPPTLADILKAWECGHSTLPKRIILSHGKNSTWWRVHTCDVLAARVTALGIEISTMPELYDANPLDHQHRYKWHSDDLWTISYTSGTTGTPKGVMLTMNALNTVTYDVIDIYNTDIGLHGVSTGYTPTYFSYLPLAHILERTCLNSQLVMGARIGFFSGDLNRLFDDIKEAKTTLLMSVPRVLEKLHMKVMDAMAQKSFAVKLLFNQALAAKKYKHSSTGLTTHALWDPLIMSKVKAEVVGPQLRTIVSGGAPLSTEIREDVQAILGVKILVGYGLTESCGAIFVQHSKDIGNAIGWLMKSNEARLIDVPELEYFAKDHKGELLMRGNSMFSGYFKRPEITAESILEGGWYRTGDVTKIDLEGDGAAIIDRAKNCFKLAQGEYIAPEKIENVLKVAQAVDQVIVTGNTSESSCIAFISLSEGFISSNGKDACELLVDTSVQKIVIEEMLAKAKESKLYGFEIPKYFVFMGRSLLPEDGYFTPTMKVKRTVFNKKFQPLSDLLYSKRNHIALDLEVFLNSTEVSGLM